VFNLKDFIEEQSEGDTDWEIDLSPLLALMVTLIPVLLLQTSFVTLKMLETTLPVLSDVKVEEPKDKKKKIDFNLNVFVEDKKSIKMLVNVNNKQVKKIDLKPSQGEFDLAGFKSELVKIKEKYPKQVSAKITPADAVSYDTIVKFLDVMRKPEGGETFKFIDDEGKKLETAVLFPDVVFGNIAE